MTNLLILLLCVCHCVTDGHLSLNYVKDFLMETSLNTLMQVDNDE